jgi:hypothetical protein
VRAATTAQKFYRFAPAFRVFQNTKLILFVH